jgi:hypothetical protein
LGRRDGFVEFGIVVGAGEGEDADGGEREGAVEGTDDHAHGGAGREDVVDEEEGGRRHEVGGLRVDGGAGGEVGGLRDGGCWGDHLPGGGMEGVYAPEFGLALAAGQFLTRPGGVGFAEKGREITTAKAVSEGVAEEIQSGGEDWRGNRLIMMKGAENDRIRGRGDPGQRFECAFDPGVEVGLSAAFEFQQAAGDHIFSGGQRQIMAKVIVPEGGVETGQGCCLERHDLFHFTVLKLRKTVY